MSDKFDWSESKQHLTPGAIEALALERRVHPMTIERWRLRGWIGEVYAKKPHKWCIAFPVGNNGQVWRAHYRSPERNSDGKWDWAYEPAKDHENRPVPALVLGDTATAASAHFFESQWDAMTATDRLEDLFAEIDDGKLAIICTRGAKFGDRIKELGLPKTVKVYAWPQNDPAGQDWLAEMLAALGQVHVVDIPKQHKDLGEWGKDGSATADQLVAAIAAATPQQSQASQPQPPPDWLKPRKVSELNAALPIQVLKGVLYRRCRIVVGGSPKAAKSWFLLQMAYSISNGLEFLQRFATSKGRVLFINFELLEGECRARLEAIQKALGSGNLDNIEVIHLRDRVLTPELRTCLREIIAKGDYIFGTFDPIYKLLDGMDERVGVDVGPVLRELAMISNQGNLAIGYSQHFAKGNQALKHAIDRISGSNYFVRDADTILTLTELKEDDCFALEIIQRSFPRIETFGVRWRYPIFERDDTLDPADIREPGGKDKKDPLIERMLTALAAADSEGGLSYSDWLAATQLKDKKGRVGPSPATFKRRLQLLKKPHGPVFFSSLTNKYQLSPQYAAERATWNHQGSPYSSTS